MRIVFLNGPPSCGKDTVVSHLVPYLNFSHLKFAAPIKRMVCGLLNEDTRWLEENKDSPHRVLSLRTESAITQALDTPRALLIACSEELLKKRYGEDFFGRVMNNEISKCMNKLVLISDSGFLSEAVPVVRKWGALNCMHIQISRPGCTFETDSRSYWEHKEVHRRLFVNNSSIHDLTMSVLYAIIKHWSDVELLKEPTWFK